MALSRNQGTRTDKMRKGKNMSNEEKGHMPQSGLWSSSEMAEHWQQDVERRRLDFAEATQRMLESAGLGPGDHVLDIAAGTGGQRFFAGPRVGPGGSLFANDISSGNLGNRARGGPPEGAAHYS